MMAEIKSSLEEADVVIHILDIMNINYKELKETEEKFSNLLKDKRELQF